MHHQTSAAAAQAGQTMAEYAVVMTVITLAVVATFALVGSTASSLISAVIPLI